MHCNVLLRMHVGLVLAWSLSSGGSLSEPRSLVCRRLQLKFCHRIIHHRLAKRTGPPTIGYDWVMSKKRNRLAPANAENIVYIFHNMRAIRKIENVDLNSKYAADVEAMLLEHSIGLGSEAESLSDSSDSD